MPFLIRYSFDVSLHCSSWFILDFSFHAYATENEFLSFDVQVWNLMHSDVKHVHIISFVVLLLLILKENEKLFERQPAPKCWICMEIQFLIDCNGVKRLATRKIGLKYCFQLIETIIFSMIAGQHATYCTQPTKNALAILRTIHNRCKQTKEKEATIPFLWYKSFWKKKKTLSRNCIYTCSTLLFIHT